MNYVEPIRSKEMLRRVLSYLKENSERDYIMFLIGCNTGLRISDILPLTFSDAAGDIIYIRERKTKKFREFPLNDFLRKEIRHYSFERDPYDYMFESREGFKPISRQRAYQIIRNACEQFGLKGIGTHTLRKTFGFHYYKKTGDVVTLQEIYGHSDPSVTLRYIGINRQMINNAIKNFTLN